MIRILNAEPLGYCDAARKIMRSLGDYREQALDRAGLLAGLAGVDVLIVRLANQIDSEVLGAAPHLRILVSATTGLDHIDLKAAAERGVTVLSLRGETAFLRTVTATAELTWGLLIALLRHLPAATASVLTGQWDRDAFKGHELSGKRLAVIGLGRLGSKVAQYGRAFDMEVVAYDPLRVDWPTDIPRAKSLQEAINEADVVSLHVPLNADTASMIDARALAAMKPDAVLLNTSRGELVDETALLDALTAGRLAGAALDVVRDERGGWHESPLLAYARDHDNLLIVPHIGGATHESMIKTEVFMARKLAEFLVQPPDRHGA